MEGIPHRGANSTSPRPEAPRTKTSDQSVPGQWHDDGHELEKEPSPAAYGGEGETQLGNEPPETRKARSIGKLFKRKPVNGGGELKVINP
jgi:hypothetical protein